MARDRRHPAVAGIDPEALAAFQAGIRKRYTDEEILGQLTDCAELPSGVLAAPAA